MKRLRTNALLSIPDKANRLLNIILGILLLFFIRVWHLSVIQHDERLEQARRPQRRVVIERAERATIRDRYNQILAMNRLQYNASIIYGPIRDIPQVRWVWVDGKRQKRYPRRDYIASFSRFLAKELSLCPKRIEDLIYSKAALLSNVALIVKEDLSEEQYFRLKMRERQWPGLIAEKAPKRTYPHGCLASDVVGYVGPISRENYDSILSEMEMLQTYMKEQYKRCDLPPPAPHTSKESVAQRLKELQERSYTLNDHVGKTGIEATFEGKLRGYRGKKIYYSDMRGNFLRQLPGSHPPVPGQRFLLTISAELQAFAEQLLSMSEDLRQGRSVRKEKQTLSHTKLKQPWIKGGACVAMDPNTGEILAMASYPRFDPNDFVSTSSAGNTAKTSNVHRWLEDSVHLAELWDGKRLLQRQVSDQQLDCQQVSWEYYLSQIISDDHPIQKLFAEKNTVFDALAAQNAFSQCVKSTSLNEAVAFIKSTDFLEKEIKEDVWKEMRRILSSLPSGYSRLLYLDLCRLICPLERFSLPLISAMKQKTISEHKSDCSAYAMAHDLLQKTIRPEFEKKEFQAWRAVHQKPFLQQKRKEEDARHTHARPYIDYLDKKQEELFKEFWQQNKHVFLASLFGITLPVSSSAAPYIESIQQIREEVFDNHPSCFLLLQNIHSIPVQDRMAYLLSLRSYNDLHRPLIGHYHGLKNENGVQLEKHLAAAFYPPSGFGYTRCYTYRQAVPQGSLFKLVTGYCALKQKWDMGGSANLNPLTIIDNNHRGSKPGSWNVGYTLDMQPINQVYKGGRLPRSSNSNIGKIDFIEAIETSSNPYFSLLAGEFLQDPQQLLECAQLFSFGEKTGIDLPGEACGHLPCDLRQNKTGLYAFAIGQHSLTVTPLQTCVMLCTLANRGKVFKPKIVHLAAGSNPVHTDESVFFKKDFCYRDFLETVGIDFPLFTEAESSVKHQVVTEFPSTVKRFIFMPDHLRKLLLKGMQQVVSGQRGLARPGMIRSFSKYPDILKDYRELLPQIVGKSSTAERVERIDLDEVQGLQIINHLWFGMIAFEQGYGEFEKPELVVVLYLPYGDYGREAAPLAAQVVKKWREIKAEKR